MPGPPWTVQEGPWHPPAWCPAWVPVGGAGGGTAGSLLPLSEVLERGRLQPRPGWLGQVMASEDKADREEIQCGFLLTPGKMALGSRSARPGPKPKASS